MVRAIKTIKVMLHTYVNFDKGLVVSIDFRNGFKERVANWLEKNHINLYNEIEFWEGGSVSVTPDEVLISGDNGLIILDRVDIKEI
jgi:phosphoribosylformimino-5-aminoimidazole carboxamide ribonucleotide (ProFAR) isomerase